MRRKLIVVSNRGPVSFSRGDDGERVARRGGGGLTTALRGLLSLHDVTWIASAISDEDRELAGAPLDEQPRADAPLLALSALDARPPYVRLCRDARQTTCTDHV